jgi:tRNA(adenine34) deaminase
MSDEAWMTEALLSAKQGASRAEVPVGAVVVHEGVVIARAHNSTLHHYDPTAHAEMEALRMAAQQLGNYRLDECEMYVTLEPCAMCAGAIMNARIRRLVYGAHEPKTGAAGSVVDLFSNDKLNHQTKLVSGVLAEPCAQVMKDFFSQQRIDHKNKAQTMRLRDDCVRTPDSAFEQIPDYPWAGHYVNDLPALNGIRIHYLDEGPPDAAVTWLCLHGNPAWSYLYRKMIPLFLKRGHRVIAPDLPGFGKSDKPKKVSVHTFDWHRQVLLELIERIDLKHIHLVVQDWGGLLGLTLPMEAPHRYDALLVMNTTLATGEKPLSDGFVAWRTMCAQKPNFDVGRLLMRANPQMTQQEADTYNAPFVDAGHRAALQAFPPMVPEFSNSEGAAVSRMAQAFWRNQWTGRSCMVIGQADPVLGEPIMRDLQTQIKGCPPPHVLTHAGHFVQEHGEDVATIALSHLF